MFILGLLAFLQTVFIPGYIAIKYLGINLNADAGNKKPGKIRQLVYGFGLSLLINYLLVLVFTAAGIYKPLTLYILLFIEIVLSIYYWAAGSKPRLDRYINLDIKRCIASLKQFFASHSLTYNFLFLLSIGVLMWYVFLFLYFLGGVFEHWDPVMGWNRFALDWANNQWPAHTLPPTGPRQLVYLLCDDAKYRSTMFCQGHYAFIFHCCPAAVPGPGTGQKKGGLFVGPGELRHPIELSL
jgi:hypothetical protein